jgi:F-box-like
MAITDQVLLAPDILYEVFLHLPQQDLLMIQRVCRTWHSIIISSTRLQAALFFPGIGGNLGKRIPSQVSQSASQAWEVNPLLQERFPAFFDHECQIRDLRFVENTLGPWNSTDWFRGKSRTPFRKPKLKDIQRMAAYARAEASWRRMIPFRPLPDELQVRTVTSDRSPRRLSNGTLKCLKFSNETSGNSALPYSWLTFGILYDIVEEAWFRGSPFTVGSVQFDHPYLIPESCEVLPIGFENLIELRAALPKKRIGGSTCVLVHFNRAIHNRRLRPAVYRRPERLLYRQMDSEKQEYKNKFESEGSLAAKIKWDDDIIIPRGNR